MVKVKNLLKGKQNVAGMIVDPGKECELTSSQFNSNKVKHAIELGMLEEVKQTASKAKSQPEKQDQKQSQKQG